MQMNLAAVGNSTDNSTTSTNATDTESSETDGAPQMVMVPSPDYMTLEMPPYGQVLSYFNRNLLFPRRTNGPGKGQSVGIASSTLTRILALTISWSWWRLAMRTANQWCQRQIREGKPTTALRCEIKSKTFVNCNERKVCKQGRKNF